MKLRSNFWNQIPSVSLDFLRFPKFGIDKQQSRMKTDSSFSLDLFRFPKFGIDKQQARKQKESRFKCFFGFLKIAKVQN